MQKLTRRTYTETFRAEAVTLAQSSNEGVAAVAQSLGVDVTTLRTWLHRAQQPSSGSETLTPSEKKELAQLRREVSELKMERDILKRRRPSSPRKVDKICFHRRGEGQLSSRRAVSRHASET